MSEFGEMYEAKVALFVFGAIILGIAILAAAVKSKR